MVSRIAFPPGPPSIEDPREVREGAGKLPGSARLFADCAGTVREGCVEVPKSYPELVARTLGKRPVLLGVCGGSGFV